VAEALRACIGPLDELAAALAHGAGEGGDAGHDAALRLLRRGRAGRARLAGKHGQPAVRWETVSVVVPDEPGALARLLTDAAQAGVNVEDIRVDHSPGQPLGMVELDVAPSAAGRLATALGERQWTATASPPPPE
jgi:prephenate dehydrogenase